MRLINNITSHRVVMLIEIFAMCMFQLLTTQARCFLTKLIYGDLLHSIKNKTIMRLYVLINKIVLLVIIVHTINIVYKRLS